MYVIVIWSTISLHHVVMETCHCQLSEFKTYLFLLFLFWLFISISFVMKSRTLSPFNRNSQIDIKMDSPFSIQELRFQFISIQKKKLQIYGNRHISILFFSKLSTNTFLLIHRPFFVLIIIKQILEWIPSIQNKNWFAAKMFHICYVYSTRQCLHCDPVPPNPHGEMVWRQWQWRKTSSKTVGFGVRVWIDLAQKNTFRLLLANITPIYRTWGSYGCFW